MVHRPAPGAQDAGRCHWQDGVAAAARSTGKRHQHPQQAQELVLRRLLPCNKGRACRFKRSCFSEEDDAVSSAMLLLACVVFAPSL